MSAKTKSQKQKAISYRRVSTERQGRDGTSLDSQREQINQYAHDHNFVVVADFFDEYSGATLERPGLQAALKYIGAESITALIALDSDRISRSPSHYIQIRELLAECGCELHYVRRGAISTDDFGAQLIEDIYGRYAQKERAIIASRLNTGRRHKVRAGRTMTHGTPPFGYDEIDGTLVIIEEEAETVREIYTMYANGTDARNIARHLSNKKVPTYADRRNTSIQKKRRKFGQWSASSVRTILKRETYTGTWHYGKRKYKKLARRDGSIRHEFITNDKDSWIPVEVPAIIDSKIFLECQSRIKENKRIASRNTKHEYLLQKRLTCQCGLPMYAKVQQARYKGKDYTYLWYYCAGLTDRYPANSCQKPWIKANFIDTAIWRWTKKLLSDPEYLAEIIDNYMANYLHDMSPIQRELDQAERQIKATEAKRDKLARMLVETDMASDVYGRLESDLRRELDAATTKRDRLAADMEQATATRRKLTQFSTIFRSFEFGLAEYDDEPFSIRKKWIDALDLKIALEFESKKPIKAHISCGLFDEPQSIVLSIENNLSGGIAQQSITPF